MANRRYNKRKVRKKQEANYTFAQALKDRDVLTLSLGYFSGWLATMASSCFYRQFQKGYLKLLLLVRMLWGGF